MQEYMKCLDKKDKHSARERTGPNVVKLENVCVVGVRMPFDAVNCWTKVWISYLLVWNDVMPSSCYIWCLS